jgi:uncharacterized protein (TIGR02594 family)
MNSVFQVQSALKAAGYDPGPIDGLWGPKTAAAVSAWAFARGKPVAPSEALPWMDEAKAMMGRHELTHNAELRAFLKSDGATLGDPAKLPWCGDFVQTCIRLGLPDEPFPGDLGANPYWARNWMLLGKETPLTYGAVVVFSRDGGGHVGFCVGGDASTVAVLGGNQSNTVSIARLSRSRLLGARWPSTFPARPIILPSPAGAMSHNEA